ncbi:MAG: anacyclamide/piricyclamide family prenylated cyclic peptide [Hormoscilla sp.]
MKKKALLPQIAAPVQRTGISAANDNAQNASVIPSQTLCQVCKQAGCC